MLDILGLKDLFHEEKLGHFECAKEITVSALVIWTFINFLWH